LLVRYRGTDYSVPTAYGHREVVIRGYCGFQPRPDRETGHLVHPLGLTH
jgi:hypothetical protein